MIKALIGVCMALAANFAAAAITVTGSGSVPTSAVQSSECGWGHCLRASIGAPLLELDTDLELVFTPDSFLDGQFTISPGAGSRLLDVPHEYSLFDFTVTITDEWGRTLYIGGARQNPLDNPITLYARAGAQAGSPLTVKLHIDVYPGEVYNCPTCTSPWDQTAGGFSVLVSHVDEPALPLLAASALAVLAISRRRLARAASHG